MYNMKTSKEKNKTTNGNFCILILVVFFAFIFCSAAQASITDKIAYYHSIYDKEYQNNRKRYDEMAASGDTAKSSIYYTFQYVLAPTLNIFEVTGDNKYLERALAWAETMVSKAVIIDKNGNRNWSGPWDSPYADNPISYLLNDFQGTTELARMARIVLTDSKLKAKYGSRAQVIYEFVRNEIVEKHLWTRNGLPFFHATVTNRTRALSDKTVILMRILTDLYIVSGDSKYGDLVKEFAKGFRKRLEPYKGGLIWDRGLGWEGHSSVDTAHANRYPHMVIDLYKAGTVFSLDDIKGMSKLLTRVIWNQSLTDPHFNNFIDGSNGKYRGRGPWGNGLIYTGWARLGEFDPEVQKVCEAVLEAILAGKKNPSLDYHNSTFGRLSLAGNLARNLAAAR